MPGILGTSLKLLGGLNKSSKKSGLGITLDELFTSKEELRKLEIEEKRLELQANRDQVSINKTEARHKSIFVAGWRPFLGWIIGSAIALKFIIKPLFDYIFSICGLDIPDIPEIEAEALYPIILGMLGLSVTRSYDKKNKTDTEKIKRR